MTSICEQIKNEKIDTFKNAILGFHKSDVLAQINSLEKQNVLVSIIAENPTVYNEMVLMCESYYNSAIKKSFVKEHLSPFINLIAPLLGVYIGATFALTLNVKGTLQWERVKSIIVVSVLIGLFFYLVELRKEEIKIEFYFRLFLKKLKSCKDPSFEE